MKKITLLAAVAIAVLSTSCTKDRVCTCTTTPAVGSAYTTTTTYFKAHKRSAQIGCELEAKQTTTPAGTGDKTTCTLK